MVASHGVLSPGQRLQRPHAIKTDKSAKVALWRSPGQGCPVREERVSVSEVCRVYRRWCADSERQQERAGVSETDSRPLLSASALVSALFLLICGECPRQDSNLRTRLRRPLLYPLSYGGVSALVWGDG